MGNLYALVVTGLVMVALLSALGLLAVNKVVPSDVSRKLMHTCMSRSHAHTRAHTCAHAHTHTHTHTHTQIHTYHLQKI